MRRLTLFERSLVGSLGYRYDLPRVLGYVAAGALDPAAKSLTARFRSTRRPASWNGSPENDPGGTIREW